MICDKEGNSYSINAGGNDIPLTKDQYNYIFNGGDNPNRPENNRVGVVPNHIIASSGDNPQRKEYILTEDQLSGISGRLNGLKNSPLPGTVNNIMQHAYSYDVRRYKRLCWQLAGCFMASLLIDIALLIALIKLI